VNATEQFIDALTRVKAGNLGLLRTSAGRRLDESVAGFDLFAGLWWPLREKNERAPRREVAWLVAKLFAASPIPHSAGDIFAHQMRLCQPKKDNERARFRQKFDQMLMLGLDEIEPSLRWALASLAANRLKLDWAQLTDDLSIWERESVRLKWAEQFLEH
jgi:CRISPR type I-E-associated protein CasB/Cse2